MHAWLAECEERGYSSDIATRAFFYTTMVPGELARTAMENLRKYGTVPTNYEGIWTAEDDDCLRQISRANLDVSFATLTRMPSYEELNRVLLKHGRRDVKLRARFLDDLDALLDQED